MVELLTLEDIKELEAELEELKVHGRAEMAEKIRVAREFGDLSENAEYDIAKEEQAKMEARIAEIEAKLRNAQIYEKSKSDKVGLGHTVKLLDLDTNEELTYDIVGSHQANPVENRISNDSPVGKALIGKKRGDEVEIKVKAGVVRFRILKIS
ncbi:MAG: transcription elongation factor GreA [Clostridiales bacterium]|nr:transcription elongation factor GreA [Clostridiales bacterium]